MVVARPSSPQAQASRSKPSPSRASRGSKAPRLSPSRASPCTPTSAWAAWASVSPERRPSVDKRLQSASAERAAALLELHAFLSNERSPTAEAGDAAEAATAPAPGAKITAAPAPAPTPAPAPAPAPTFELELPVPTPEPASRALAPSAGLPGPQRRRSRSAGEVTFGGGEGGKDRPAAVRSRSAEVAVGSGSAFGLPPSIAPAPQQGSPPRRVVSPPRRGSPPRHAVSHAGTQTAGVASPSRPLHRRGRDEAAPSKPAAKAAVPALLLPADGLPAGSEAVAARRAVDVPPLKRREAPSPARRDTSTPGDTSTPDASRLGGRVGREIERCDEPTRSAGLGADLELRADLARDAATRVQAVWRGTLARDALERTWEEEEEEAAAALIQAVWREVRSRRSEVRSRPRAERHEAPRVDLDLGAEIRHEAPRGMFQGARRAASAQFGLLHRRGGAAIADVMRAAVAMRKSPASPLARSPLARFSRERPAQQQSEAAWQASAETSVDPRASEWRGFRWSRTTRTMEDAAAVVQASWRGFRGRQQLQQQWEEEERNVAATLLQASWRGTTARKGAATRADQKRLAPAADPGPVGLEDFLASHALQLPPASVPVTIGRNQRGGVLPPPPVPRSPPQGQGRSRNRASPPRVAGSPSLTPPPPPRSPHWQVGVLAAALFRWREHTARAQVSRSMAYDASLHSIARPLRRYWRRWRLRIGHVLPPPAAAATTRKPPPPQHPPAAVRSLLERTWEQTARLSDGVQRMAALQDRLLELHTVHSPRGDAPAGDARRGAALPGADEGAGSQCASVMRAAADASAAAAVAAAAAAAASEELDASPWDRRLNSQGRLGEAATALSDALMQRSPLRASSCDQQRAAVAPEAPASRPSQAKPRSPTRASLARPALSISTPDKPHGQGLGQRREPSRSPPTRPPWRPWSSEGSLIERTPGTPLSRPWSPGSSRGDAAERSAVTPSTPQPPSRHPPGPPGSPAAVLEAAVHACSCVGQLCNAPAARLPQPRAPPPVGETRASATRAAMGKQIRAHAASATDHLLVPLPRHNSYIDRPRVADNGRGGRGPGASYSFKRGARPSAFGPAFGRSVTDSSRPGSAPARGRAVAAKAAAQAWGVAARAEAAEAAARGRAERLAEAARAEKRATQRRAAKIRAARLEAQRVAGEVKAAGAGRPAAARNGAVTRARTAHFADATAGAAANANANAASANAANAADANAAATAAAAEQVLASPEYMMGLARQLQAQGRFDEAAALLSARRNTQEV